MEKNQNTLQEVQEDKNKTQFTHFKSDEEMLSFYLTFSRIIYLNRIVTETSDVNRLQILYKRLRSLLSFTQMMNCHQWEEGIADIQKACGTYILAGKEEPKKLLRSNNRIGRHLEFITKLSSNNYHTKRLEAILSCHLQHLVYLLDLKGGQNKPLI